MANLHFGFNVYFKLSTFLAILLKILSFAKLRTDVIQVNNKKSLKIGQIK